jgi:hypothetical protein
MNIIEKIKVDNVIDNPNLSKREKLDFLLENNTPNESKNWGINVSDSIFRVRFVVVTPELAETLLTHFNSSNRPITKSNVANLVKEMTNDKWLVNGESITFNETGDMTNGQHRLVSLIKANVTLLLLTITGLKGETFATIDGGRKRATSDVLAHAGVVSAKNTSSLCKFIYGFKQGKYCAHRNTSDRTLNNTSILNYYNDLNETEVHNCVNFGQTYSKKANGMLTPTVLGGMYYIFNEIDKEKSYEFLSKLCTGDNLSNGSPIFALRNRLLKAAFDKTYYLPPDLLIKNIAYCWEKYVNGETVKNIKLPEDYSINI